jgi:hypothetical protein
MMTIEQQALALVNEVLAERGEPSVSTGWLMRVAVECEALCRTLERHEAFRQEVSEAVKEAIPYFAPHKRYSLSRFIIEPPVDPLVEVLTDMGIMHVELGKGWAEVGAEAMRAALAKHGLQITGVET